MESIIRERKTTYVVYIASDGKEFDSDLECKNYEKTTKCLYLTKYKDLVNKSATEYDFFKVGSDEYTVDRLIPLRDESDVDTLMSLYIYYHPRDSQDKYNDLRDKIRTYWLNKDILFIGRGYGCDGEDNFLILASYAEICKKMLE